MLPILEAIDHKDKQKDCIPQLDQIYNILIIRNKVRTNIALILYLLINKIN